MKFHVKKSDFINIRHSIPGRIRLNIRFTKLDKFSAKSLPDKCLQIDGVIWGRFNHKCSSLVLGYNVSVLSAPDLVIAVREIVFPDISMSAKGNLIVQPDSKNNRMTQPVRSALGRFLCMSALGVGVFVRDFFFSAPLSQAFFSPLGIITAIAAIPLIGKGIKQIKERRFTLENFLGGAVVAAIAAGEATAALEILWVTSGADLMTVWVTERSRRAVRDILEVTARNTYIRVDGVEVEVPVSEVRPGDIVIVHTGEKISVDGVITEGGAFIDEAPVNGRAEFMSRTPGDQVFAGTFVRQGVICVQAERVGDNTYLSRILKMVEDSLKNKAPIEGAAEELGRKQILIGFIATAGTFFVTQNLWRTFSVMLVMACPCATILAASTAVSAALSAAARRHILIKGGRYLEEAGQIDVVCFDKTGTLTTNQPEIRDVFHVSGINKDKLLQLAYSAEKHNLHPIALAIKAEAERLDIEAIPHDICEYIPGKGIRSEIRGTEVLVGNARLMGQYGVSRMGIVKQVFRRFEDHGLTVVCMAVDRKIAGILGFANKTRFEAGSVLRYLQNNGVKEVSLITGDEKCSALRLSDIFDFSECHYSVMPEEKADIIQAVRNKGQKVMMVGDGINDALALAQADVGIAMGAGGSEVAIEAADIALVNDDLNSLIFVRSLSQNTMKIINQNFLLATGTNVAGIALGAVGWLSPVVAGLFHIIHTAGILANSGRLLFHTAPEIPKLEVVNIHNQNEKSDNIAKEFLESEKKVIQYS